MSKTSIGIEIDFSTLENVLQQKLNANPVSVSGLRVRCFSKKGNVVIMIEHPEDVISHPRRIFKIIRQTIQEENIVGNFLIYLVVHEKTESTSLNKITLSSEQDSEMTSTNYNSNDPPKILTSASFSNQKKATNLPLISFIIALSILGISLLVYVLSRPCVISKCVLMDETTKFADESLSILNEDILYVSLAEISKSLTKAIENLQTIPRWSKDYSEAQKLTKNYQIEINKLTQLNKANNLINQANSMTKNYPLTPKEWQQAVKLSEEAISLLQEFPQETKNSYLKKKEAEFQNNLVDLQKRISQEDKGKQFLLEAKDAAKLAESRQATAKSLENLQLVEVTWKTAIQRLEKIPIETTSYIEKQDLLRAYIAKFLEAQERKKQEELAINLYNQAIQEAQQAKNNELNNQWSASVLSWQNALNLLSKIPEKTFQYAPVIKLTNAYQLELSNAKNQLTKAVEIENIKNELKNICLDTPKICDYSVSSNIIQIFLTNTYLETIEKISKQKKSNEQVISHISQVEKNLQYISSKYSKPLEVYNPNRNLITKYQP